jgi:hypothetical protein
MPKKLHAVLIVVLVVPELMAQVTGSGSVQTVSSALTAAQIASLRGSPVTLIPAPGAGKIIAPVSMVVQYKFGTTPYTTTSGGNFNFSLGPISNGEVAFAPVGATTFIDQVMNQVSVRAGASIGDSQARLDNQDLRVTNDGSAEWANGDGTVIITVYYTVVPLQ